MAKIAWLMRANLPEWRGTANLYRMVPPLPEMFMGDGGKTYPWVVGSSATENEIVGPGGEALFFPSNERGEVTSFRELEGDRGTMDQEKVLERVGYQAIVDPALELRDRWEDLGWDDDVSPFIETGMLGHVDFVLAETSETVLDQEHHWALVHLMARGPLLVTEGPMDDLALNPNVLTKPAAWAVLDLAETPENWGAIAEARASIPFEDYRELFREENRHGLLGTFPHLEDLPILLDLTRTLRLENPNVHRHVAVYRAMDGFKVRLRIDDYAEDVEESDLLEVFRAFLGLPDPESVNKEEIGS
jgi:hypothetical protein